MAIKELIFSYLNHFSTEMLLILILTALFWWYSNKKLSYWKDRNVPYVKPLPFFGSLIDLATTPMHVLELNRYFSLGPIHGFFEGLRPVLVVGDPKLIRDIFITDFQIFPNRRVFQGCPILSRSLLISEGDYWRRIRSIVSPTFTTKKLKRILGIFEDCSKTLVQNFKISAQKEKPLSVKRIFNAFVLDVTASSAFSTKIDSLNDSKSEFVQQVNKNFGIIHKSKLCLMLLFTSWHHLKNIFKSSAVNGSALQFFSDFIKEVISERKRTKQTRDDFLQLLLDIEKKSTIDNEKEYVENDDDIDTNYGENISGQNIFPGESQKNLTHEELVSQCVTFLVAANDTTASLLTTTTHILATNESIQEKAYKEVAKHLQETNGKLTYEALQKMKYLDNIMSETLRLYPPVMRVCRRAEKEYNLGETGINIQKGVVILLPILALHRDPKYYPDPEKFDPDRFSDEEVAKRDPNTYLPFGHGPRTCIGMRFAQLSAKVCLVYIISSFVIKSCSQTKIPMELLKDSYFTLQAKDVTVKLEIRKDCPLI